jgi:hypothetical protein
MELYPASIMSSTTFTSGTTSSEGCALRFTTILPFTEESAKPRLILVPGAQVTAPISSNYALPYPKIPTSNLLPPLARPLSSGTKHIICVSQSSSTSPGYPRHRGRSWLRQSKALLLLQQRRRSYLLPAGCLPPGACCPLDR